MRPLKKFGEFEKAGIAIKRTPDTPRANSLIGEAKKRKKFLSELKEKIGLKDENANYLIENTYDILIALIRANLLKNGYITKGEGAHEAEVSFMRNIDFEESDVRFMNDLRYFRNGILYYGKDFDSEYGTKVLDFLDKIFPLLMDKLNNTYYDQIAEGYEELHGEEQLKKVELIKKHLKLKKTDKLLDVGCGTGLTTIHWDCKRYGIDPAKQLLKKANKGPIYKLAPAENIPYPDYHFDVVVSITAIQNFKDIEKGLKEIKRVGKKKFVLTFLKKSTKKDFIDKTIRDLFKIKKIIEEDKDLIYLIE